MHMKGNKDGGEEVYKKIVADEDSTEDPCVSENLKNTSQERKEEVDLQERKCTIPGKLRVCAIVVMVVVVAGVIGIGVAFGSSPYFLHEMGFTSKGIAGKTFASRLMASTSAANNHTIPKDSWVSWLQRAGQKGLERDHQAFFGTIGAVMGLACGVVVVVVAGGVYSLVRCYNRRISY